MNLTRAKHKHKFQKKPFYITKKQIKSCFKYNEIKIVFHSSRSLLKEK